MQLNPPTTHEPIDWADWLEIYALLSDDSNSSKGDLESAIRLVGVGRLNLDEIQIAEEIERFALSVLDEIELRAIAAGDSYPFDIEEYGVLELKGDRNNYHTYIFCLLLSYQVWTRDGNPAKLFEKLSSVAASIYLNGSGIDFGHPRDILPSNFMEALQAICGILNENSRAENFYLEEDTKDDGIDIIAWAPLPDKVPSQLILFGQCATGKWWDNKLQELDPIAFMGRWLAPPFTVTPIKSFFIPHRISRKVLLQTSSWAGIVFDRCRLSYLAQQYPDFDYSNHQAWINVQFQKLLA